MHVFCFAIFILYFLFLLLILTYFVILLMYNFSLRVFVSYAGSTYKTQSLKVYNHLDHYITFEMYIFIHSNDNCLLIPHSSTHTNSKTYTYSPHSRNNYSPPHNQPYTHNNYIIMQILHYQYYSYYSNQCTSFHKLYIHETHTRKHYHITSFLVTY